MIFTFKKLNNTKSCARHELSAYIMLTYNGNKLKFVAYSEIENLNPTWVGQTRIDKFGRSLQIWEADGQYYITIG